MDNKGQALVEFAITIPLLALIITGTFQFGEIFLAKQKLQQAAKYGLWLVKEGENNITDKLMIFLTSDKPKLNRNRIRIDMKDISLSSFYPSKSEVVEIEYEFIPIKGLQKFVPVVKLKGRCVATIDTWQGVSILKAGLEF